MCNGFLFLPAGRASLAVGESTPLGYCLRQASLVLVLFLVTLVGQSRASITVQFGDVDMDVSSGSGTANASIDIIFSNSTGVAAPLAGYSLFVDIGPVGQQLPAGVTFADPAATYATGLGAPPLIGAANPGTIELNPAVGDLGLGQLQFFDGEIGPGESFTMVSINLQIDLSQAVPGDFGIVLSPGGQNTLHAVGGEQPFDVSNGTLRLTSAAPPGAVPEPTSWMIFSVLGSCLIAARFFETSRRS